MPNRNAHKAIGTASGIIVAVGYGLCKEKDSYDILPLALGGGLGGYLTGTLADKLEPATSPNHRSAFHGIGINGVTGAIIYVPTKEILQRLLDKAKEYDTKQDKFMAFLCRLAVGFIIGGLFGHISHLVADSSTSKSIPLLN
jgi:hypothetical protein